MSGPQQEKVPEAFMPPRNGGLTLWAAVLSQAEKHLAPSSVLSLLQQAAVMSCTSDEISIRLPSTDPKGTAAVRELLASSAGDLLGRAPSVRVMTGPTEALAPPTRPQLNENYTFGSFVVGPSNRLAHAAALAISESPGAAYNPLFLYSASGMGKTHLQQATCRRILEAEPTASVVYISCEAFQNLFFNAVESGRIESFRQRFRFADVLAVDDVHFLASRERTQEEFFHTFNSLYNNSRQIILSCDSPPREIPQLEERLVSRFKWGLVAEIEPPDFETRLEIVRRKAEMRGLSISTDVMEVLARRVTSSIRELEGAVLKVAAYARLLGSEVSVRLAEDVLAAEEGRLGIRRPTAEQITKAVEEYYGLEPGKIAARDRSRSVSLPRQVCMFLARELTDLSLEAVGAHLGGRDHSTVKHACEKVKQGLDGGGDLSAAVRAIKKTLSEREKR